MRLLRQIVLPAPATPSESLSAALEYAERGFAVFPCFTVREGRCSCGHASCGSPGKHPIPRNGLKAATKRRDEVRAMFSAHASANIAIATGAVSGVIVLDVDPLHGGDASLEALQGEHGRLPETVCVRTGSGGQHHLFQHPGVHVKTFVNIFGPKYPGLDCRGDGGYVIAAPSRHVSGETYAWLRDLSHTVAPAPAWLLQAVVNSGQRSGGARRLSGPIELPADERRYERDALTDRLMKVGKPESRALMRAMLAGERLAELGHHDETLRNVAGVMAWALPLDAAGEQVLEIVRPALTALEWQDGLEHCEEEFLKKFYRARRAFAEQQEGERRLQEILSRRRARLIGGVQ